MEESSIEEDIVLLKEMQQNCLTKKEYKDSKANKKAKAIENILQDYKRVLKENERISSENGIGKRQYEELVDDYEKLNLENIKLQKENEELKSKNKKIEEILQGNFNELYKYYKKLSGTYQGNSIPIQKVKEKIEELDIEISTCEYADDDSEEYKQEVEKDKRELLIAKKVLQQLLEESKKS